ncbi:hypothetical protein QS306_11590 [Paraburkholderia bonniea]|uniref:hypothetical protein n=1 Tax=Paraburkholderia bonniea TaxID=2152891 RepID=UPI002573A701|nr:hypothetical protein [Paraburkholderia bonniea]WJF89740.1 hypothetical protein QS306_11590 [Paraburkholderia bonniea]WJF93054.1 hypothetical protein QS308_11600 [Paraburkholderia bonniea]
MKTDLIEYIASRTPLTFLQRVVEHIEAAHHAAHQHSETFADPERFRILPQLQHYRSNEALRTAALDAGMEAVAPHTDPKGERFSLVAADNIRFGQICVPFDNKLPRQAKHRRTIAALNEQLEPVNLDLFTGPSRPISDGLGCLVVAVKPHKREPQSVPFAVMVGVPYTNLKGWHLLEPIAEIMAAYHPAEPVTVPDLAWARLKKQIHDSEG